jgi:hypothetical protein
VAAIDCRKAFDMIEHSAIWKALESQEIHPRYTSTQQSLYKGQLGVIMGRQEADSSESAEAPSREIPSARRYLMQC